MWILSILHKAPYFPILVSNPSLVCFSIVAMLVLFNGQYTSHTHRKPHIRATNSNNDNAYCIYKIFHEGVQWDSNPHRSLSATPLIPISRWLTKTYSVTGGAWVSNTKSTNSCATLRTLSVESNSPCPCRNAIALLKELCLTM